jgi:hypothetical protein
MGDYGASCRNYGVPSLHPHICYDALVAAHFSQFTYKDDLLNLIDINALINMQSSCYFKLPVSGTVSQGKSQLFNIFLTLS